jgi:hypothetical protein
MDVRLIRRRNLRALIDNDLIAQGNVEAWCSLMSKKYGVTLNPNFIRQLVPKRVAEADRNFGEKAARKLEEMIHLPHGTLDQEDGEAVREDRLEYATLSDDEVTLVLGYRACDERGRNMLLTMARVAFESESGRGNVDTGPSAAQQLKKVNPADVRKRKDRPGSTTDGGRG